MDFWDNTVFPILSEDIHNVSSKQPTTTTTTQKNTVAVLGFDLILNEVTSHLCDLFPSPLFQLLYYVDLIQYIIPIIKLKAIFVFVFLMA